MHMHIQIQFYEDCDFAGFEECGNMTQARSILLARGYMPGEDSDTWRKDDARTAIVIKFTD